jgi:CDP-diacylglycerol--serine O-phosphatidyltransferase
MKKNVGEMFLLPSFFSLTNLFFGFLSLTSSFQGKFSRAAVFIIIAAILDGFDGIVARATNAHSDFGTELDSLADAVSFGAAPALLLYFWGLRIARPAGLLFSFIYLSAGILRLARYNVRTKSQSDRKHYTGLTIPSAAMFMSSIVLLSPQPLDSRPMAFALALLALVIAACMISTIKYRNFMGFNFRQKIDIRSALVLAVLVGAFIFYPKIFLISFFSLNVLSGPATSFFNKLKKKALKKHRPKEVTS